MEELAYKQLRVFVSSIFNDMNEERKILLEKVFPMVAAFCHQRNTEFIGIDLRWGVSEEQSQRGETVSICMAEIDRCRPLFIGILGERYGWVLPGTDISVTEQEIRYGALEAPESVEAFFYLRDSTLTQALCGSFEPDPRQAELRRKVRESGFPVMDNYRDLDSFGRRVCADLIAAVERLTSAFKELDPVETARRKQLFLAERCVSAFVDRPAELARLRGLIERGGLTLLTGEAGVGKTALLAKWALDNSVREDIWVYRDFGDTVNHFTQKALMAGFDASLVRDMDEDWTDNPQAGRSCIRCEQVLRKDDWGGWLFLNGYLPSRSFTGARERNASATLPRARLHLSIRCMMRRKASSIPARRMMELPQARTISFLTRRSGHVSRSEGTLPPMKNPLP